MTSFNGLDLPTPMFQGRYGILYRTRQRVLLHIPWSTPKTALVQIVPSTRRGPGTTPEFELMQTHLVSVSP